MLETKAPHLDDFTLLRYVAFDLDEVDRQKVANHLDFCPTCRETLGEIEALNRSWPPRPKIPAARLDWIVEELPGGRSFPASANCCREVYEELRRCQLRIASRGGL